MKLMQYPTFAISLPPETRDASTHIFVLPVKERVRPSVIVKEDSLGKDKSLKDYVDRQCKVMAEKLEKFQLIEGPREVKGPDKLRILFDWGKDTARFRQAQMFCLVGKKIFAVTGSAQASRYHRHAKELEAIMLSVKPK